jgi:hypothetical protein
MCTAEELKNALETGEISLKTIAKSVQNDRAEQMENHRLSLSRGLTDV